MICINCNKYEVSNKYFKLCIFCNKKRLDEKKTSRSGSKYATSIPRTKKRKAVPIRAVSAKGAIKGYQRETFRQEIITQREAICTGCKGTNGLTISHTIPVSLRSDLEFEGENVHVECMDCHYIWEHGSLSEKKKLLSYEQKVEYIKSVDRQYYERKFKL